MCPMTFKRKKLLKLHSSTYHIAKTYKCQMCPKSYKSQYLLKAHSTCHEFHKIAKTYKCQMCPKTYRSQYLLKAHSATHEVFRCEICNDPFRTNFNLMKHRIDIHKIGCSVKCPICNIELESSTLLTAHMKSLHSEKHGGFRCAVCKIFFVGVLTLMRHKERYHRRGKFTV